jgi:hypothetical protein
VDVGNLEQDPFEDVRDDVEVSGST